MPSRTRSCRDRLTDEMMLDEYSATHGDGLRESQLFQLRSLWAVRRTAVVLAGRRVAFGFVPSTWDWWTKSIDTPPLVTTSPAGTAAQDAGVLGVNGTEDNFGRRRFGFRLP